MFFTRSNYQNSTNEIKLTKIFKRLEKPPELTHNTELTRHKFIKSVRDKIKNNKRIRFFKLLHIHGMCPAHAIFYMDPQHNIFLTRGG